MNLSVNTEYPIWFLALCVLLGVVFSLGLYFSEKKNEYSTLLKWILSILRFFTITFLSFLLLNPLIRDVFYQVEKPVILVAHDNSASVLANKDSSFIKNEYLKSFEQTIKSLEEKYEVKRFTFGNEFIENDQINFNDQKSNMSEIFSYFKNNFTNRNVGALIFASDGLFNEGMNPIHISSELLFPIYTIALGDTAIHRDLIIKDIKVNKYAFQGNEFEVEILLQAKLFKNQEFDLKVINNKNVIYQTKIKSDSKVFNYKKKVILKAEDVGLQSYKVTISRFPDEITHQNNDNNFYVDVIKGKKKVLILSNAPHPDISAIKQSLQNNNNYEVDEFSVSKFTNNISQYQLIILHQLPGFTYKINEIQKKAFEKSIPLLIILGDKTDINYLNTEFGYLSIKNNNNLFENATPKFNSNFKIFSVSEGTQKVIKEAPPLQVHFGQVTTPMNTQNLFYQKIGNIETEQPLWFFSNKEEQKYGIILGTGLWRWKLYNYQQEQNSIAFDELVNKSIQYLALKEEKKRFNIDSKNRFLETESVFFTASLYNKSYEPDNTPDINITLVDEAGNATLYSFAKTNDSYYLEVGNLLSGSYHYSSKLNFDGEAFGDEGEIIVKSTNVETSITQADHVLLRTMALQSGGKMFYKDQLDELKNIILENDKIVSVSYQINKFSQLLNFSVILILLLLILFTEWFIRKRAGGY